MRTMTSRFPGMTIQMKLDLFEKLILPKLNYGSEICGTNEAMALERVHLKLCKDLLGV